jgi:CubicO group peptidase (beta-lactamase class C family)
VIERVTGWSYPVFYNFRVIERLGMTDSFSLPETSRLNDSNRATGYNPGGAASFVATPSFHSFDGIAGAGSFYMSAFDLCALEEALESNFLVSSLQDAYTKGKTTFGVEVNYGFGWWLRSASGKIFAEHDGLWNGYRAWFRRCLDRRLSIYTVSNNSAANLKMVATLRWRLTRNHAAQKLQCPRPLVCVAIGILQHQLQVFVHARLTDAYAQFGRDLDARHRVAADEGEYRSSQIVGRGDAVDRVLPSSRKRVTQRA